MLRYKALGVWHEVTLVPLGGLGGGDVPLPAVGKPTARISAPAYAQAIEQAVGASSVLRSRIPDLGSVAVVQAELTARPNHGTRLGAKSPISTSSTQTLMTQTVIAEGLRQADFAAAKTFGATVIEEGLDGKVLLRVESIEQVFGLVELLIKREVGSVTPNFVRRISLINKSAPTKAWSHNKIGVAAAWAITRGSADVRVAVLDEGVDTAHPSLKAAVVAERDFIGSNGNSAMPAGNDAHGTACAGIVLSRDNTYVGIAPNCSLIAARIAMDDGSGSWVFDDFATADAIDWSWRQGAAVLSNSWGGGAPSDAISRAFGRARTQGRDGLGAVVAIAAGNYQIPIDFPGNLPGYVTVGASNPADERKTRTSSDGENWWGSSYGATMHLLAPGVFIWTTDISGPAGYDAGDFTQTFNGTSSATPAVAGAAALMISANPALSGTSIRNLLGNTAKKIQGQTTWTPELGWGRLDVGSAVAAAKVAGAPPSVKPAEKKAKKRAKKKAKKAGKKK
jgi:thermitase